jgi:two-component system sensor histidine kinase/response regulator
VEAVKTSADSLLSILNDVLDFSKLEAGWVDMESIPFSVGKLIEDVSDILSARVSGRPVELMCSVAPDVPATLSGDPTRVRQVLLNLAGNALKFTEEGEVVIRAELAERGGAHATVSFEVRDTGIGIPSDRIARVFDSFTQVDSSTTRKYGGTGLGLAISKHLVEVMGGRITAESEIGHGSVFRIALPFGVVEDAQGQVPGAPAARAADIRGLRVLIVDDNETNRAILRESLMSWGCRPYEAASGEEALAALRDSASDPFPLILLDGQMPGMDGFAVAEAILNDASLAGPRIVMLTSLGYGVRQSDVTGLGIAATLTKPVKQSQLLDTLAVVMGKPGAAAVEPPEQEPLPALFLEGVRILLVEDNPVNQQVVRKILEKAGCAVDAAGDGQAALDALERAAYDLVVMDVQMPVMDGFEATAAIRSDDRWKALPVVAMTAHALQGDRDRCLAAGMTDYIPKPVDTKQMFDVITRWVGRAEATSPADAGVHDGASSDTASSAFPPADLDDGLNRLGGDVALWYEIAALLIEDTPSRIEAIGRAIEQGDAETVRAQAHSLKGAAANLGAKPLQRAAAQLETDARESRSDLLSDGLDRVREEFSRFRTFVDAKREAA